MLCVVCCVFLPADETIVPPDVPSCLSSQGTLSERQEVCVRVDVAGGPLPNGHVGATGEKTRPLSFTGWRLKGVGIDSLVFSSPPPQCSTAPSCVRTAWRIAATTPKTPTTSAGGAWRRRVAPSSSSVPPHPRPPTPAATWTPGCRSPPRCATGRPMGSESSRSTTACCSRTSTMGQVRPGSSANQMPLRPGGCPASLPVGISTVTSTWLLIGPVTR